ncbi:MAG: PaREP1 family protein [Desulfurococcales archaeon]|nr:PaREP1 family protein [Desulfurococcales archaeon]
MEGEIVVLTVRLPRRLAERVEREARNAGLGVEEYLVDLVLQHMDLDERAQAYIEKAQALMDHAREELAKGNVRQAAEKAWGAAALAVKAYAAWKEGRRLSSHGEIWEYTLVLRRDLGEWVGDSWAQASAMHTCFYEGWCKREHVEQALNRVERLVGEVRARIKMKPSSKHR